MNATIRLQWHDGEVIGVWLESPETVWTEETCAYWDECTAHVATSLAQAGIVAPRLRPWPSKIDPHTLILAD